MIVYDNYCDYGCSRMRNTTNRLWLFMNNFFNYLTQFVKHNSIDNIELVRFNISMVIQI